MLLLPEDWRQQNSQNNYKSALIVSRLSTWRYPHLRLSVTVAVIDCQLLRGATPRSAANQPHAVAAVDQWDRRTDVRTPDRYISPAPQSTNSVKPYSDRYIHIHKVIDITESMVTKRLPFCGYDMTLCVELMSGYLLRYSNKMESTDPRQCPYDH